MRFKVWIFFMFPGSWKDLVLGFSCATPKAIVVLFASMSRSSQKVPAKRLTMPYIRNSTIFYAKHLLPVYLMNFLRGARKSNSIWCFWNVELKFERNDTHESIIFMFSPWIIVNYCSMNGVACRNPMLSQIVFFLFIWYSIPSQFS